MSPFVLVVHKSLPVRDVKELIALARQKPGALDYGSSGNGTVLHLAAELLKEKKWLENQDFTLVVSTPETTLPFFQSELVKHTKLVK